MTVPANIEVFNQVAAHSFVRLYHAFPTPVDLDPGIIVMDVALDEKYAADSPHHEALTASAADTIQYLIDEKFIRLTGGASDLSFRGFQGAVLTGKGFALLQKTPDAVDAAVDRRSYLERIKSTIASGAKGAAPEALGAIIARLLGAI